MTAAGLNATGTQLILIVVDGKAAGLQRRHHHYGTGGVAAGAAVQVMPCILMAAAVPRLWSGNQVVKAGVLNLPTNSNT